MFIVISDILMLCSCRFYILHLIVDMYINFCKTTAIFPFYVVK